MLNKPQQLHRGDQVAIVSLSSGVLGEPFAAHQRRLAEQRMQEFGLTPVYMPNALRGLDYLAAHPEARAADLKTAFLDPTIKGVFCAIGGDDTYRLLPYLLTDDEFIQAVQNHPKLFSGFSDTTINHLMFYKLGMQSFYGPNVLNDWAELGPTLLPYTKQTLEHYFANPARTVIPASGVWYEERTDFSQATVGTPRISHPETRGYEVLRGSSQVQGRLLGGCLDSLNDILTTMRYPDEARTIAAYEIFPDVHAWQDKILFIETSEERPAPALYHQMLAKLDEEGVLAAVAGIIAGKPQNEVFYEEYKKILYDVTAPYKTPILFNVNFGHAYPRTALPYGAMAEIDFDHRQLSVEEPFFKGNTI
jgi:muramoyltetrapeptide carboxypeptidase LdcA involved in peptidoglycan recycling